MICAQTLETQCFYLPVVLQLFRVFGFFISLFVAVMARQRMHVRFCTRRCLVGGRYTPFLMIAAINRKKRTYTGFTNDNENDNVWHQKWSVRDTALFSFSSPFPLLFPFLSFFLSSPFAFPFLFLLHSFSFPFSFLFPCPFLPFLFFFFRCPFLIRCFSFLFLSFSSPFPILSLPFLYSSFSFSLSSLMWILWSRCEASAWKNDKRKKITCEKTIWKCSGVLQYSTLLIVFNHVWTCSIGVLNVWYVLMFRLKMCQVEPSRLASFLRVVCGFGVKPVEWMWEELCMRLG